MEVKSARTVFQRLGKTGHDGARGPVNRVCSYWLAGNCTRNPCRFLHTKAPLPQPSKRAQLSVSRPPLKQVSHKRANIWRRSPDGITNNTPFPTTEGVKSDSCSAKKPSVPPSKEAEAKSTWNKTPIPTTKGVELESGSVKQSSLLQSKEAEVNGKTSQEARTMVCQNWLSGTCVYGEMCENLHSWFCGNGFSMLAKLEGHTKAVTGIAFPSGSDKLFTCGDDRTIRGWDCNTGECKNLEFFSSEVGCLVSEGPRLYLGLENVVKVSDLKTGKQCTLTGPVGQVKTMIADEDMLYVGTHDGTIWAWRFSPELSSVELIATMVGHSQGVASLFRGRCNRLYSGSRDNTIKVWDLNSFQCIQTLKGHIGAVMSVLCWNEWLLSCSLDGTIKAWAQSKSGEIELVHSCEDNNGGCLALCGIMDAESKPILLCSCEDNTVRLYDLPSFAERGRIFSKQEVRSVQSGPQGLIFTGDATGQLTVWKLDGVFTKEAP